VFVPVFVFVGCDEVMRLARIKTIHRGRARRKLLKNTGIFKVSPHFSGPAQA
jgi:hypothetical protein